MPETSHTDQQKREFKAAFAAKRRRQWLLVLLPVLAAVIVIVIVGRRPEGILLGVSAAVWRPVAFAVVIAAVVFSFINWRCPACGRYLGRTFNPAYCPRCGIPLRDD